MNTKRKSILIIGASNGGKSTTMQAVCKKLNPTKVFKLCPNVDNYKESSIEISTLDHIFNDTFIIEVNAQFVLVCAGAPTEQKIKITILIDICIEINIDISFFLVSMRSFEKKEGYKTQIELSNKSHIILTERIYRINDDDYKNTNEWKDRINRITKLILENI
ncbi:MAG: hypothetical protein ABI388_01950 [Bacteroidia bacterium]